MVSVFVDWALTLMYSGLYDHRYLHATIRRYPNHINQPVQIGYKMPRARKLGGKPVDKRRSVFSSRMKSTAGEEKRGISTMLAKLGLSLLWLESLLVSIPHSSISSPSGSPT